MYRVLRNTHLLAGLFCAAFLLMYGLSSVQMAHNAWFNLKPSMEERRVVLAAALDGRAAAQDLIRLHGFRGDLTQVQPRPNLIAFRMTRPGTVYDAVYQPVSGVTVVRISTAGFWGMLNRLHHVAGLWHGYTLINLWGLATALVSILLTGIGLTGVYLWFKIYSERKIGTALLAFNMTVALTLIYLMRSA